jgi:hypothetical protein
MPASGSLSEEDIRVLRDLAAALQSSTTEAETKAAFKVATLNVEKGSALYDAAAALGAETKRRINGDSDPDTFAALFYDLTDEVL